MLAGGYRPRDVVEDDDISAVDREFTNRKDHRKTGI